MSEAISAVCPQALDLRCAEAGSALKRGDIPDFAALSRATPRFQV